MLQLCKPRSLTLFKHQLLKTIKSKSLKQTQIIHAKAITNSWITSIIDIGNLVSDAYFKCNVPDVAFKILFDEMPERDSYSWSAVIGFYSQSKMHARVFDGLSDMVGNGVDLNRSSLISCLSSSAGLGRLVEGEQMHAQAVKRVVKCDVIVWNVLIKMYSMSGKLGEAVRVFDDVEGKDLVTWTSLLSGYSNNGSSVEVWELFVVTRRRQVGFSDYVAAIVAKACGELDNVLFGEMLHSLIYKYGCESNVFGASALLDMYVKHEMIECSQKIFDSIVEPNVVSWTTMITGYVHFNGVEALKLFKRQIQVRVAPDPHSFSSILGACANIPSLEFGKQVHALVTKLGSDSQIFIGNALVRMYSRCGVLSDARKVLDFMRMWNVISWSSMISGYGEHGCGFQALEMFKRMREENIEPNALTFIAVLSACSRSGLVEEGLHHFRSMEASYGIEPGIEHYTCIVDLLARAGMVKDAEDFINNMPFEPGATSWAALLSGCRTNGDIKLGLKCAEELFRLEPNSAANHVLLANMYAANGRLDEMRKIRVIMQEKNLKKESGQSWIEISKNVNVFSVGDHSHPQTNLMYSVLHQVSLEMEEESKSLVSNNIFLTPRRNYALKCHW